MENTIENAEKYLSSCPINEAPAVSVFSYALAVNASLYDHIAEPEKQVEELGGQSILDTMKRNKALREENADLRRALSECKAKARIGVNQNH